MRQLLVSAQGFVGVAALAVGVFLEFGAGFALIVAGVFLVVGAFMASGPTRDREGR